MEIKKSSAKAWTSGGATFVAVIAAIVGFLFTIYALLFPRRQEQVNAAMES